MEESTVNLDIVEGTVLRLLVEKVSEAEITELLGFFPTRALASLVGQGILNRDLTFHPGVSALERDRLLTMKTRGADVLGEMEGDDND